MKPLTALALGMLGLAGLASPAAAQYPPYGYYRPPMYAPTPGYYAPGLPNNPYYPAVRYYPAPNYAMPMAPMPMAPRPMNYTAYSMPRPMPTSSAPMVMQVLPPAPSSPVMEASPVSTLPTVTETMVPGQPAGLLRAQHGHGGHVYESSPAPSCSGGSCSSCGNGACDSCGDSCCEPRACCEPCATFDIPKHKKHQCEFYVDGSVLYVQPRWQNNPAFIFGPLFGAPPPPAVAGQTDFDFDFTMSPRGEVGFSWDSGWGVRARYWYFSQTDKQSIANTNPGVIYATAAPMGLQDGLGLTNRFDANAALTMHVGDLEITHDLQVSCWALRMGLGGRYASIRQTYSTFELDPAGNAVGGVTSGLEFNGGGPSVSFEAHRRLGKSHFAAYCQARGSLLFGSYRQNVTNFIVAASKDEEDMIPVFEIESGFECVKPCKDCLLFARVGLIGQTWFGVGNTSDSNPTFFGGDANAQSRSNLGFIGAMATAGIQF